ncbi:Hsp70 family protein [Streptomyces sp. NPDC059690]|uniref:Hsp70 family protein n=1 Tax=Streptomyces sp. NPDC059690 TaxID=3346907 RepID=UPI00367734F0
MPDTNATIVILTALPVEYAAVKAELLCVRTFKHESGTRFEEGFLKGSPWRIIIAEVGPGNGNAAVITERANHLFRPRAVLFCGIAGSLKEDVVPGHVVISTRVHAYQGGRQEEDGFLARPESWEANNELLQAAKRALASTSLTCHFKAVAAGDVVHDAAYSRLLAWLRERYNDAVAIEMEGAGVAQAAHLAGGLPALVIRGISDRADGSKGSSDAQGLQRIAARHAAQATMSVLRVLADDLNGWDYCVSYMADDRSWAEWAEWELRKAHGPRCRVLLRKCPGTDSEYRAFPLWDGVARADRIVAIMSERYLNSAYRQREWQAAGQADAQGLLRKVIPVRTDDGELPSVLGAVRPVDLRDLAVDEAREALLLGVREAEAGAPAWFDGTAPSAPVPEDDPLPEFPGYPGRALAPTTVVASPAPRRVEAPAAVSDRQHGSAAWKVAPLADAFLGGGRRRLRRAVNRVDAALSFSVLSAAELDRGARYYRRALRLALRLAPGQALHLFATYDRRVPDARYAQAFGPEDEGWLTSFAGRGNHEALMVVFELAGRLGSSRLQRLARDALTAHLAQSHDAALLIRNFERWRVLGLLEGDGWVWTLQQHATRVPLERNAELWTPFLRELPDSGLPRMFAVHLLLGRAADAAALAVGPDEQRRALDCCLRSRDLRALRKGLGVARALGDDDAARKLQRRLGNLLFEAGRYGDALPYYQDTGMLERSSECHRLLGRPLEALAGSPDDQPHRLLALIDACVPRLGELVERNAYAEAASRVQQLSEALRRLRTRTSEVAIRQEDIAARRDAVLREGRDHFRRRLLVTQEHDQPEVHAAWCAFEEAAGELVEAAARAEAAGKLYRAHELYRRAGWYGEADRVLHGDLTTRGLKARAAVLTAGGDLPRAAQVREEAEDWEEAITLLLAEKDLDGAIRCLRRKLGEEAVEDPRLAEWLWATGEVDALIRLCLTAIERKGASTRAVAELRDISARLGANPGRFGIEAELAPRIRDTLDALDAAARKEFEDRVPAWIAQARREIDERFSNIWGLDLGTSQCAAAIYDSVSGEPVACEWKGRHQFPSTLCVDKEGNELIGLTIEQIQTGGPMAFIRDIKRSMGTATTIRAFSRRYRPEEVAARFVRHARQIVENFLAAQVRNRVADLAHAELDHVDPEWLNWAERQHNYPLSRPKAIVTIPAHFPSKARSATRDACDIAGVKLVRMIHEPTAACVAANFQHKGALDDAVTVVDLGAGTLDISHMDIGGGVHQVKQIFGNNDCGSRDFDPLITQALKRQLERQGLQVPSVAATRRLEVAAEAIKISLSTRREAEFPLPRFVNDETVQVSLDRAQLADILAPPLDALRRFCAKVRTKLHEQPDHLILVGGPMLSPLVRELFEKAFGVRRTASGDPRSAVSHGAALVAAQLDGRLTSALIVDVTPFALGIRTQGRTTRNQFTTLIDPNSTIPTRRSQVFTTEKDDQPNVSVEIFSGVVSPDTQIGAFALDGIRPARRGTPQIEVTFELDASCVLNVTARDRDTGNCRSIQVSDPTLLTPEQVADMTDRLKRVTDLERLRRERDEVCDRLGTLVVAAEEGNGTAEWNEFQHRLDAFSTPPTLLDAATQRTLASMYAEAAPTGLDLAASHDALTRQCAAARALLAGLRSADLTASLVDEARTLGQRMVLALDQRGSHQRKVAAWNSVLIRSAVTRQELLTRFRDLYARDDLSDALSVLDGLSLRLDRTDDIKRLLHCIARTGDLLTRYDRYRTTALDYADRLAVCPLPPAGPEGLPQPVRSALVGIVARDTDGTLVRRAGFLVTDRLVATVWQHPARPDRVAVRGDGFEAAVKEALLPGPESAHIAILRLARPVPATPLHIGYPELTRLGGPVWAPAPRSGERLGSFMTSTVIDRDNVPERQLSFIRTSLRLPPDHAGAPLLNDLGEAIGLVCIGDPASTTPAGCAVSVDALTAVLARAGWAGPR